MMMWPFKKKPSKVEFPVVDLVTWIALNGEQALVDGGGTHSAYTNVAPGSPGYSHLQLVLRGKLATKP